MGCGANPWFIKLVVGDNGEGGTEGGQSFDGIPGDVLEGEGAREGVDLDAA